MRWTWFFLRILLGGLFLFACFDKIRHPELFARALFNYRLLPSEAVNLLAIVLPWVEALAGTFLIFGWFEWASLTLINCMLAAFMGAISISLARGLDISCGCFTLDPNAEKMNWLTLLRDSAMLIPGLLSYFLLLRLKRPPIFE